MATLALSAVSQAVFGVLQDATLQGLTAGGWHDDLPQAPTYPCGWFEVSERDIRGFGTGGLPEVELRLHVLSRYGGQAEAQAIVSRTLALLKDQLLTIAGYQQAGRVFYDETLRLPPEEINGVKVYELMSRFRIYAEEV